MRTNKIYDIPSMMLPASSRRNKLILTEQNHPLIMLALTVKEGPPQQFYGGLVSNPWYPYASKSQLGIS